MSEEANEKEEQWKRIIITHVERIQELERENKLLWLELLRWKAGEYNV